MTESTTPSFAALAVLEGEVLPERMALSLVTINVAPQAQHAPAAPEPSASSHSVSDGHGGTVYYACQTTRSAGSHGVIGATGLGPAPSTTTTCVPAAATSH